MMHILRPRSILLALAVSAVSLLGLPAPVLAAAPAVPRVAIVRSGLTEKVPQGNHAFRSDFTARLLRSEFGTAAVTVINDKQLADVGELRRFDVVVLVRQLGMTYQQRTAVRDYVSAGGGLVCSFGTGRWDYVSGREPEYVPAIKLYRHLAWEWGEVSELFGVQFYNDPVTFKGYRLLGETPSSHPILQMTANDLGRTRYLEIEPGRADANEFVTVLPGAEVTPLIRYDDAACWGVPREGSGWLAGWVSEYKLGRTVYFGCQITDVAGALNSAWRGDSKKQAQRLFLNSVRWAGTARTFGSPTHNPYVRVSASCSNGLLRVSETLSNPGGVTLRGQFGLRVYDGTGAVRYAKTSTSWTTVSPGKSAKGPSWKLPLRSTRGSWTVRVTFRYHDYFQGGFADAIRDLHLSGRGRGMVVTSTGAMKPHVAGLAASGSGISGADRYGVATAASFAGWSSGASSTPSVVLATGRDPADALAAAPLAGALDAPLLLAPAGELPRSVRDELGRLFAGKSGGTLYVASGARWGMDVAGAAEAMQSFMQQPRTVTVRQLGGQDVYATAASVAREVGTPKTGAFADTVIIANGASWTDGLAASSLAAACRIPVLYVTTTQVPRATARALASLGAKHSIVVGGLGSVAPEVEVWLEAGGYRANGSFDNDLHSPDTRLTGRTRYDVSAKAVAYGESLGGIDSSRIGIASGSSWPDSLAAGPTMGVLSHPVLLVDGSDLGLSHAAGELLVQRRGKVEQVLFFGGTGSLSPYVRGQVSAACGGS